MEFLTNGWNILLIVLGFGMLIFLHELGHFLAARWARLRCESFAVGMGPVVVAYRPGIGWALGSTEPATIARFGKSAFQMSDGELAEHGLGETEYSLRALPIGGFVRLVGQEDIGTTDITSHRPRSYSTIPVWKRMVVISAGVVANLVTAIALFVLAFLVGVQFEAPVVGIVSPDGPAARATVVNAAQTGVSVPGMLPGDTIIRLNGDEVLTFADIQIATLLARPGAAVECVVERPGVPAPLELSVKPQAIPQLGVQSIGIAPARTRTLIVPSPRERRVVEAAMRGTGLIEAGVLPGATLESIAGTPVTDVDALTRACEQSAGTPVATTWLNPGGTVTPAVLSPRAEYQLLPVPASTEEEGAGTVETGLAGLVPLVRVSGLRPDSQNEGVLQEGDIVLRAATIAGPSMQQFREAVVRYRNNGIPLEVLRNGKRVPLLAYSDRNGLLNIDIDRATAEPLVAGTLTRLGATTPGDGAARPSPAASLGIAPLSRVTSVGGQMVNSWLDIRNALQDAIARHAEAGSTANVPFAVPIEWETPAPERTRGHGTLEIGAEDAAAIAALGWQSPVPLELFDAQMVTLRADGNPLEAAAMGFRQTGKMITMTYLTIDRLLRGSVGVDQLRGPVGIVHIGTHVADRGFMYLVFFLAAISVNLAVLNFLPLPIVDGGLFLYLVYERITGRQPSLRFQSAAMLVGLCLIGSLFLLTFYQDVMRLVKGG